MILLSFAIKLFLAYLLGSLLGSRLLGSAPQRDIRTLGNGDAGDLRAWLSVCAGVAIDIGKGGLAVWLGFAGWQAQASPDLYTQAVWCGFAAAIGHVWPVFFAFRGGKGAPALIGAILVLCPLALAPVLVCWLLLLGFSGYVSLATVAAAALLPLFVAMVAPAIPPLHQFALAAAVLIAWTHRDNLLRLHAGTEERFERARVLGRLFEPRR